MSKHAGSTTRTEESHPRVSGIVANSFCAVVGAVVGGLILYVITESNIPRIQQTQTTGGDSIGSPQVVDLSKPETLMDIGKGQGEQDAQLAMFHDFKRFSAEFESAFTVSSAADAASEVTISFDTYRELLRSKRTIDGTVNVLEPYYERLMIAAREQRARVEARRGSVSRDMPTSSPAGSEQ